MRSWPFQSQIGGLRYQFHLRAVPVVRVRFRGFRRCCCFWWSVSACVSVSCGCVLVGAVCRRCVKSGVLCRDVLGPRARAVPCLCVLCCAAAHAQLRVRVKITVPLLEEVKNRGTAPQHMRRRHISETPGFLTCCRCASPDVWQSLHHPQHVPSS